MRVTVQQFAEQTPPERWTAVDSRPGRVGYGSGGLAKGRIAFLEGLP